MKERDKQIALLAATGQYKQADIAAKLGCHVNTVARSLKLPDVQALIEEMSQEVQTKTVVSLVERFNIAADEAFEVITGLMRGAQSERVQLQAAEQVLDRAPSAPKRTLHGTNTVDHRYTHTSVSVETVQQLHEIALVSCPGIPPLPETERQALDAEFTALEIKVKQAGGLVLVHDRQTGKLVGTHLPNEP
jgi:hypothetical protein